MHKLCNTLNLGIANSIQCCRCLYKIHCTIAKVTKKMGPFKSILVIGSSNTDGVIKGDHFCCRMRQYWVVNFLCPPDKKGQNWLSPYRKRNSKRKF
jgi:hypothetical protein